MLTKKEMAQQRKLEARLRRETISRKSRVMVAKTGNVKLNTCFSRIQHQLKDSQDKYGYVVDLSKAA